MSFLRSRPRLAIARALAVLLRSSGRRAGVVLVYHAVDEPHGDPARELVPPHGIVLFEAQLRHLKAHYRLVRAEVLLSTVEARRRGERFPVAITFDDDLASHKRLAAPILSRLGVPATFFLCGASLERPFTFWWQRLQRALELGLAVPVADASIHEQAARIERMGTHERDAVGEQLAHGLGPEPEDVGVRSADVRELVAAGFDIGFHTLRHDRLTELDGDRLALAMSDGRAPLEAAVGRPLTTIAYPHGKANTQVARAARDAGFGIGFTGRHEPVVPASEPLLLGRLEPTFGSVADFAVQLVSVILKSYHR